MSKIISDLRYSLRRCLRTPGPSLLIVFSIAFAVATNTFSVAVLELVLSGASSIPQPQQVRFLEHGDTSQITFSYPQYLDFRDRAESFKYLTAYRLIQIGLQASGDAQGAWGYEVSGNYFQLLNCRAMLGRLLIQDDDQVGGQQNIVLSYSVWQRQFASDRTIVGRIIHLDKLPFTVVGVTYPGVIGTERMIKAQFWIPIQTAPRLEGNDWLQSRSSSTVWIIGRLKAGTSSATAEKDLNTLAMQMAAANPNSDGGMKIKLAGPGFLGDSLKGPFIGFSAGLLGLTALIFLTACANVGGLIAARASDRSKEVALALALGAKKRFIAQQLLSEAFIFGTVGGLIGILAAALILRLISQWRPPVDFPIILPLAIDFRIIAVSVCLAIGCALLASLVPLIRSSSIQPYEILKGGFNVHRRVRSNVTIQGAMLFVQVALCCALLLASFVSIRSLRGVMDLRLGFDPKGVIVANYNLALSQYSDDDVKRSDRTIPEEMSKLPGVIGVGIADKTPLSLDQSSLSVFDAGTTDMRLATQKFVAYEYLVSPTYFPTARTAVRMGRDLSNGDDEHAPKVAVVNSTFARLLCGSQRSCVQTYFKDASGVKLEIVGVVEDGKYATIAEQPSPAVFLPRNQVDSKSVALVVRSEPNANLSAETVRAAIRRTDPSIVVSSVGNWIDDLDIALLPARATAVIMGALGLVAIMLASSGLFSAAANTVSKRSREFGIRAALGARPFNILSAAFARLIVLVISGAIFGVAIGVAFQKVMGAIVYGAGSLDWLTITSALLAVFLLTASSVALPASRALGINPSQLLREE